MIRVLLVRLKLVIGEVFCIGCIVEEGGLTWVLEKT